MRVLVLHFPRLPIQLYRRQRPDLAGRPLGLLSGEGDGAVLAAVSVEATADGVEAGMSASQARHRCPRIYLDHDNAAACLDELEHLASILRVRTTPDVAIVSRYAIALKLEGMEQRFANEETAAQAILALARSWSGLDVRCAVGPGIERTSCEAARARRHPVIVSGTSAEDSGPLPMYSPVSATFVSPGPLTSEQARLRLSKMLASMRPLLEAQPQSLGEVRRKGRGARVWREARAVYGSGGSGPGPLLAGF